MCSHLKLEGQRHQVGDLVPTVSAEGAGNAVFTGFAQNEKLKWWLRQSRGVIVGIRADSFAEKSGDNFKVPTGFLLGIKLNEHAIATNGRVVGRKGEVKIITRKPKDKTEARIHPRLPLQCSVSEDKHGSYVVVKDKNWIAELPFK